MLSLASSLLLVSAALPAFAQDADGDGIADQADVFPCDPTLAGVAFAPAEGAHALIMYEDQWPGRGDLDFNDVVLAYHFQYRFDPAGRVVSLVAVIDPVALGGIFDNGLALRLPVPAASVATAVRRVADGSDEPVSLSGSSEVVLRLSPNLRELFSARPGQINSTDTEPRIQGDRLELEVTFAEPVTLAPGDAPHDLFIFRTHYPAHEIHRPEYAGTEAMDLGLFGTQDDGSSGSRFFVDTSGLPFALILPIDNPYPREGVEISNLFPQIIDFAASAGTTHRDFYASGIALEHAYVDSDGLPQLEAPGLERLAPDRSCVVDLCSGDDGSGTLTCGEGACQNTIPACQDGAPSTCTPVDLASPEVCDGIDNDCNGEVDEGCHCIDGQQQSCYSGSLATVGVGVCRAGVQLCGGGQWGPCTDQILPSAEVCNGLDDDCDGITDQGFGTVSCGVGECRRTLPACAGGALTTCVPGDPVPETCDGRDNDCDGVVDNDPANGSCPSYPQATSACVSGACAIASCAGSFRDCDGVRNNGCEADTMTNARHCGACNLVCPNNFACENGACACVARTCGDVCGNTADGCGGTLSCPTCRPLSVTSGLYFSCGLRSNGTVQCWGRNSNGQLGDGTTHARYYPVTVQGVANATAVLAGDAHACALIEGGTVRCWGLNSSGQLGDGTTTQRPTAVQVSGLSNAVELAVGRLHTCARRADNTAVCWGAGASGQLGDGGTSNRTTPVVVSGLSGATSISGGFSHTCATVSGGGVRCWGANSYGQIGDGSVTQRNTPVAVTNISTATQVSAAWRGYHTCARLSDATVRCWGYNGYGQLGDATSTDRSTPVAVSSLTGAAEVSAGGFHTCARLSNGGLRCWGWNANGELGDGTYTNRTSPVAPSGVSGVAGLSAGYSHTCVTLTSGVVSCWGANSNGELGDETNFSRNTAAPVYAFPCTPTTCAQGGVATGTMSNGCGQTIIHCGGARPRITSGLNFSCALRSNGTVACWGRNSSGQLGLGDTQVRYQPTTVPGLTGAVSLVAGESHACALLDDGTVRCWGLGSSGQLGNNSTLNRTSPVEVSGIDNAVSLTAGRLHTCARLGDGTARCWGSNGNGQLGDGSVTQRNTPVAVAGLDAYLGVIGVAAGYAHTCVLLTGGTVRCFGVNAYGELGDGSTTQRTAPVVAGTLTNVIDLQAGWRDYATCALINGGTVRCWGYNGYGQLGDGSSTNRSSPVQVSGITTAVEIVMGQYSTCARLSDATLRCWGWNGNGQLGDGTYTNRTTPVTVSGVSGAVGMTLGGTHGCALMTDGAVRCWGSNADGELGDQTTYARPTAALAYGFPCQPTTCAALGISSGTASNGCGQTLQCGVPTQRVASGLNFTCAVRSTGAVQCWGRNSSGQLGDGSTHTRYYPVSVPGITSATAVVAGDNHACALVAGGGVRCWGLNSSGQLGDGTTSSRLTPISVSGVSNAVAITAGRLHTCARLANGTARCWGANGSGQLGDGTTVNRPTPVAVQSLGAYLGVVGISAGFSHTCAVLTGGTVRCWGANSYGQLGNGTVTDSTTPVLAGSLSDVVEVSAAWRGYHTCARRTNNTLFCWGYNGYGQLGDGSSTDRSSPVQVGGVTNAVSIGAGGFHTCARLTNGNTSCWGWNGNGQLGDGSYSNRVSPVTVSGLSGALSVWPGYNHTCALMGDNTARCWGSNTNGELGDQTTYERTTPVSTYAFPCVPTSCALAGVSSGSISNGCGQTIQCGVQQQRITAGLNFSCALRSDGTAQCWGRNVNGQLGDGTTITRYHPALVNGISGATALVSGDSHACALQPNGTVRCWGLNSSGQLGDGSFVQRTEPVQVVGITSAVALTAGRAHTCARLSNGGVRCWGANTNHQLGDGSNTNRSSPVDFQGLQAYIGVTQVTAGDNYTCLLLTGGTVRCVGANDYGQLGDGTVTARTVPTLVGGGLANVVEVQADWRGYHTCARLADNTARCWGYNAYGQLGDNTSTQRSTPVVLSNGSGTLTGVMELSLGGFGTCVRLSDGTARCAGWNGNGQIGDGTYTNRVTPTVVSGLTSVADIAAGYSHACALRTDGSLRCWGANANGELGDQTTFERTTTVAPYAAPCLPTSCAEQGVFTGNISNGCGQTLQCGPSSFPQTAAGLYFTCAIRSNGSVQCWGRNSNGQLGDGTTVTRYHPDTVSGVAGATAVVAGDAHACALLSDRTVRCWGLNSSGQLGDGTTTQRTSAVSVTGLTNAVELTAGRLHTCARLMDQTVRCWGANGSGQLGDGTALNRSSPVQMAGLSAYLGAVSVTAGFSHTCVLLTGRTMRCVGDNAYGQLGNGTVAAQTTPVLSGSLENVLEIATAWRGYHTCARLADGTLRCWGYNGYGQVGNGALTDVSSPVVAASGLTSVVELSLGAFHTCARRSDGTLRCWGWNGNGQLGDGSYTNRTAPVVVSGISTASHVSAGYSHSCARLTDGSVRCWGSNGNGEIGDQTTIERTTATAPYAYPCEPTTCGALGISQGTASNGCGQVLQCGGPRPRVASGLNFSCALGSGGSVSCWGRNVNGQLGDGTTTTRYHPAAVSGLAGAVSIVAGDSHACALLGDATVRCWGINASGQLGDGSVVQRTTPVQVSSLSGVLSLSAGRNHTCAVVNDGSVRCWGANGNYQLGDGSVTTRTTPGTMQGLSAYIGAAQVATGDAHTCVLLSGGTVRCVGANGFGQIGNGTTTEQSSLVLVSSLSGVAEISASGRATHTCARLTDNTVRCWGYNAYGQLGDGSTLNRSTPVAPSVSGAAELSLGTFHTCARLAGGTVQCWGWNGNGQLGDGSLANRTSPVTVSGQTNIVAVGAGYSHTCLLHTDGSARCFGSNANGELGDQTTYDRATAQPAYGFPCVPTTCAAQGVASGTLANGCGQTLQCGQPTPAIAAGLYFSCAVRSGAVSCWGRNSNGQLGDGSTAASPSPRPTGITDATGVVTGDAHACALRQDRTVACWGLNSSGQLGDGTTTQRTSPVVVPNLSGVLELAAGRLHTCARLDDGSARCWGANGSAQLGDGSTTNRTSPVLVQGLGAYLQVTGITAGFDHTCVLLSGGTARCWGGNAYGQLGIGSVAAASTPTLLGGGLSNIVEVTAGSRSYHTCARLADNTVRCWGYNAYGQLGDATSTDRALPTSVSLTGVTQLSGGGFSTCARLSTGGLRCWGWNGNGQVGDGSTTNRTSPVTVSGLSSMSQIAAGYSHSCAVSSTGVVSCWGSNANGELGDGSTTQRLTPVTVVGL